MALDTRENALLQPAVRLMSYPTLRTVINSRRFNVDPEAPAAY
jgi:hypothetical protein